MLLDVLEPDKLLFGVLNTVLALEKDSSLDSNILANFWKLVVPKSQRKTNEGFSCVPWLVLIASLQSSLEGITASWRVTISCSGGRGLPDKSVKLLILLVAVIKEHPKRVSASPPLGLWCCCFVSPFLLLKRFCFCSCYVVLSLLSLPVIFFLCHDFSWVKRTSFFSVKSSEDDCRQASPGGWPLRFSISFLFHSSICLTKKKNPTKIQVRISFSLSSWKNAGTTDTCFPYFGQINEEKSNITNVTRIEPTFSWDLGKIPHYKHTKLLLIQ